MDYTYKIFIVGITALFGISLLCKPVRKTNIPYPAIFVLSCVLNILIHNIDNILLAPLVSILLGVLLFNLVFTYSQNIERVFKAILIIVFLNVFMLIFQSLNLDIFYGELAHQQMNGSFEKTSSLATLFLMAIPLFNMTFIPLLLIPNYSGLFLGSIILYFKQVRKYMIIPGIVLFVLLVLFVIFNYNGILLKFNSRKDILFSVIKVTCLDNFFFGFGLNSFSQSSIAKYYSWNIDLKNEPIEWFYSTGITGVMVVAFWLRDILIRMWNFRDNPLVKKISLSILGFLFISSMQGVFHNIKLLVIFIPILAWLYILTEQKGDTQCLLKM